MFATPRNAMFALRVRTVRDTNAVGFLLLSLLLSLRRVIKVEFAYVRLGHHTEDKHTTTVAPTRFRVAKQLQLYDACIIIMLHYYVHS